MAIRLYHLQNGNLLIAEQTHENDEYYAFQNPMLMNSRVSMVSAKMNRLPKDLVMMAEDNVDPNLIEEYYEKLKNKNLLLG